MNDLTTSPLEGKQERHPALRRADETVDARMVASLRFLLAVSALTIILIDPPPVAAYAQLTYVSLALYCGYSAALCAAVFHDRHLLPQRPLYWADVFFYVYIIMLTGGAGSIFFNFFFFAILVASFSRGYAEGLAVTIVATVLSTIAGLLAVPANLTFEVDRSLMRPVYLLLIGYMVSYWGGREIMLRRRLELLKEVGTVGFPTFGVDHAMHEYLRCLLRAFDVQACLLAVKDARTGNRLLYRVDSANPYAPTRPQELSDAMADILFALPPVVFAVYGATPGMRAPQAVVWDPVFGQRNGISREQCAQIVNLLETSSLATVPYKQPEDIVGRLYVVSGRRRFSVSETEFLGQVAGQIALSINNVMRLEALTHDAAVRERSKISRDIHDSTVQSYIGLKIGLEALCRETSGDARVGQRLRELLEMATITIEDLRNYIDRLSGQYARRPEVNLVAGLLEQKRRYRDFHGIDIDLRCDSRLQMTEWMAGEAYQIVCEGLSNVLRHTQSKRAFVNVSADGGTLCIDLGNPVLAQAAATAFTPRSISERARSLGGSVSVGLNNDGDNVVTVRIPLWTHSALH